LTETSKRVRNVSFSKIIFDKEGRYEASNIVVNKSVDSQIIVRHTTGFSLSQTVMIESSFPIRQEENLYNNTVFTVKGKGTLAFRNLRFNYYNSHYANTH
jgi:hypothetical protein